MNMSNTTYPNLMCFGRDISNCPITETCPYYEECQEEYLITKNVKKNINKVGCHCLNIKWR